MDSVAWIAADEWLFRFPKYDEVSLNLDKEVALLPTVSSSVELAIPNFEYVGKIMGRTYVGYRMIKGKVLSPKTYATLPRESQKRLTSQLAKFLDALHSIPLSIAKSAGVTTNDMARTYKDELFAAREFIFPQLSKTQQSLISSWYEDYLSNEENFDYECRLLHADLSEEHILFDEKKAELVGIIDFGDLVISDPAYEFKFLFEEYGLGFVKDIVEASSLDWGKNLAEKLRFWLNSNWVTDILIHHKRKDFEERDKEIKRLSSSLSKLFLAEL